MAINAVLQSHERIYGCSPAGDDGDYVVLVWGMDQKGQQIKVLIPCATETVARCEAAQARFELGARAHVWIASMKNKDLRLLGEVRTLPQPTRPRQKGAPVLSTTK